MKINTDIQNKWGRYKAARIYDKVDTTFGVVTILDRKDGKVMVLIDEDITATFKESEFIEFVR